MRNYLIQLRQETGLRLVEKVYADGAGPSKVRVIEFVNLVNEISNFHVGRFLFLIGIQSTKVCCNSLLSPWFMANKAQVVGKTGYAVLVHVTIPGC